MTDPIIAAARFLLAHDNLEWLRHRQEADEVLTTIDACARVVAGIARGPAPQKYLGPCGALCEPWSDEHGAVHTECPGDIYGRSEGNTGRCRTCGAEVDQADRRAWLDGEVRAHAFRAAEIANAYGINVKTIRSWATERQARYDHSGTCVQTARPAKLQPHARDRDGRPLFLVGDVLDLAAGDAARREEARAERARRKEASAA
jgi:hypothetical protein